MSLKKKKDFNRIKIRIFWSSIYFFTMQHESILSRPLLLHHKKKKWWKAIESDKKSLLRYQPRILRIGAHTLFSSLSWWGWGFGRECRPQRQTVHQRTEYWLYGGSNVVNLKEVASRVSNKKFDFLRLFLTGWNHRAEDIFLKYLIISI